MMKLVKTKDEYGCAVACLAMVTGRTYDEVSADFETDFNVKGMQWPWVKEYVGDAGFAVIEKNYAYWNTMDQCREEMLKPFAPVHIVSLRPFADSNDNHAVVMTKTGKLVCPSGSSDERVRQSYVILSVIGLYR